ncbi:MAG: ASKHA domain-containing protein [Clostridia bacterium]
MPILTIWRAGTRARVAFEGTPLLGDVLLAHGFALRKPCGGRGLCLKCLVSAEGALSEATPAERAAGGRLACQTRLLGDATVFLAGERALQNIAVSQALPCAPVHPVPGEYALAIDVGTTTLAGVLIAPGAGRMLASASMDNPQCAVAADVIGRIASALDGQGARLQQMLAGALDRLTAQLCQSAGISPDLIAHAVIAGNTTMLYLLSGRSPEPLSHAPFDADCLFGCDVTGAQLGLDALKDARIYLPPCLSAFVGADISCGVLASGMRAPGKTHLLIDIGTNGEIALWTGGALTCTATAAGPAFEGGEIRMGVGSVVGAVDRVWLEADAIRFTTIGEGAPVGICGSGLLDAAATLVKTGAIEDTGAMKAAAQIAPSVFLYPEDVRNLQLAKSAIAAGLLTLCQVSSVSMRDIDALFIAGGFGQHVNLQSAADIGLIPRALIPRTKTLGNASLSGALMLLLDDRQRGALEAFSRDARTVALSGSAAFCENYLDAMMLEPLED